MPASEKARSSSPSLIGVVTWRGLGVLNDGVVFNVGGKMIIFKCNGCVLEEALWLAKSYV